MKDKVFSGHCRNCKTKIQITVPEESTGDGAAEKAAKAANCINCGNKTGMILGKEIVPKSEEPVAKKSTAKKPAAKKSETKNPQFPQN